MPSKLAQRSCLACEGAVAPLGPEPIANLLDDLGGDWRVNGQHHLEKTYPFPDFAKALRFTNVVGAVAEEEGHHPDIHLAWGKVRLEVWTHKIDGLTESDFIFAAKADEAFEAGE